MHILIVEDEPKMAALLRQGLTEEGHHVVVEYDGRAALELAQVREFDLLVLDLMLPGMDGFQITQALRANAHRIPILILTARDSNDDLVRGLNAGADDYLTKPFSLDVLLARIRAVTRRGPIVSPVHYRIGNLEINTATRQVRRGSREVVLTKGEYGLLELLAKGSPRVLSKDTIIAAIWGSNADVSRNNLEVFVHFLRSKLEHSGESKLIRTIRGIGYSLGEDEP